MIAPTFAAFLALQPGLAPNGGFLPIIANPASMYCLQRGGRLRIVTRRNGGQIGICALPNGRRVEEWTLYRSWKGRPRGKDLRF
jgi:putative hemolysin